MWVTPSLKIRVLSLCVWGYFWKRNCRNRALRVLKYFYYLREPRVCHIRCCSSNRWPCGQAWTTYEFHLYLRENSKYVFLIRAALALHSSTSGTFPHTVKETKLSKKNKKIKRPGFTLNRIIQTPEEEWRKILNIHALAFSPQSLARVKLFLQKRKRSLNTEVNVKCENMRRRGTKILTIATKWAYMRPRQRG